MKNYNKLPYKERKRHFDYAEKQEKTLMEREMKRLEKAKREFYMTCRDQEEKSDKERQEQEAFDRLKEFQKAFDRLRGISERSVEQ